MADSPCENDQPSSADDHKTLKATREFPAATWARINAESDLPFRFGTWCRIAYFDHLEPARVVVQEIRRAQDWSEAETLADVVMPDHVHWLCSLGTRRDLAGLMNAIKGRITKRIHCLPHFEHRPRIWQRGYFDHALRRHEDVIGVARYLIENPVRAGLVTNATDYPHWDLSWLDDLSGQWF